QQHEISRQVDRQEALDGHRHSPRPDIIANPSGQSQGSGVEGCGKNIAVFRHAFRLERLFSTDRSRSGEGRRGQISFPKSVLNVNAPPYALF
ncbi:MAG: hypothetical protein IJI26_14890, partial [Clostridia bacterium]|nr:hypothetical protein [Clostridia bacterium]